SPTNATMRQSSFLGNGFDFTSRYPAIVPPLPSCQQNLSFRTASSWQAYRGYSRILRAPPPRLCVWGSMSSSPTHSTSGPCPCLGGRSRLNPPNGEDRAHTPDPAECTDPPIA